MVKHAWGKEQKMATISERSFANVIRERRRQLDLTQEEVALRINTSVPYVGLLEAGKRHPSEKVVTKIAQVLGLDARQLFLLANPGARFLVSEHSEADAASAWMAFCQAKHLRKSHNITDAEMRTLSQVAMMGEVRSSRDFLFILNTIRQSLG
jgi:DNA-binding XRE family transcriptional regulator